MTGGIVDFSIQENTASIGHEHIKEHLKEQLLSCR
jgi:hypothetical protein